MRILSLDGGPGTFLTIRALFEVEQRRPGFLEKVDLFSGTSSGGLAALYLAKHLAEGHRALDALDHCRDFVDEYARALGVSELGLYAFLRPRTPLAAGAPYRRFREVLERAFGDTRLRDLYGRSGKGKAVVVMSFESRNWYPFAFRNFCGSDEDEASKELFTGARLVDVALATSAFPPLVPIVGTVMKGDYSGFLDGYLSANNPVMSAVSLACRDLCHGDLSRMMVLSFGGIQSFEEATLEHFGGVRATLALFFSRSPAVRHFFSRQAQGNVVKYLTSPEFRRHVMTEARPEGFGAREHGEWGWLDVLRRPTLLPNVALHGATREIDRQCRRLLGGAYRRSTMRMNVFSSMLDIFLGRWPGLADTFDDIVDRARRCAVEGHGAAEEFEVPFTPDDRYNAGQIVQLVNWIERTWMKKSPPLLIAPVPESAPEARAKRPKRKPPGERAASRPPAKRAAGQAPAKRAASKAPAGRQPRKKATIT